MIRRLPSYSITRPAVILLAAVALLSACAERAAPPPTAARATAPTPRVRPPAVKPPPPPDGPAGQAPAQIPAQVPTAPAPAPPGVSPERLKGLNEAETLNLLGEPARRGERPPARVWTYESPHCRLELAFYLDVSGRGFRVLSYDLKPEGREPLAGADCLDRLKSPHR